MQIRLDREDTQGYLPRRRQQVDTSNNPLMVIRIPDGFVRRLGAEGGIPHWYSRYWTEFQKPVGRQKNRKASRAKNKQGTLISCTTSYEHRTSVTTKRNWLRCRPLDINSQIWDIVSHVHGRRLRSRRIGLIWLGWSNLDEIYAILPSVS